MLNGNNPVPLHIQLKQILLEEVRSEKYANQIPSERELMERFQVSRSTVREAVNHLVRDGVLEKIHGKGTFIRSNRTIHDWLNNLHSFTETVQKMGMHPSAKLLTVKENIELMPLTTKLQTAKIFTFTRLRSADQKPIAIEQHFYAQTLGEELKKFDLNEATIYDVLEHQLNISLIEAEQTIKVIPIPKEEAAHLNIMPNTNVLCIERIILGENEVPIELYKSIFHPDYYELKLKTKR